MRTNLAKRSKRLLIWVTLSIVITGCAHRMQRGTPAPKFRQADGGGFPGACDPVCELHAMEIEYPDVQRCGLTEATDSLPPREMADGVPTEFWEMSLEEAIGTALQNGKVLKDLGGRVLTSPQGVGTIYDPSIQFTHPRLGEEAALAAFDAQWAQAFTYRDGTQRFNNVTLGGGAARINQDLFRAETQIGKTATAGTQFQVRSFLEHDHNDIGLGVNEFSHAWTAGLEASMRQPLLRGGGVAVNRIAGPGSSVDLSLTPGVVIARITGDITLAEFELSVREFVNEIETAYWQLYLAYRTLDANRISRDAARKTWQGVEARFDAGMEGGAADQEAQAREQVYFFEEQVLTALNGTSSGAPGVYQAERRLRRLLGLPVNDGALIRPVDEPTDARVVFDWDCCVADALVRRVELRQQMWRVKQRELEIVAAKNFLLPQLDAVATYRATGLGDDLSGGPNPSALADLWQFNNDQVEAGLQLNIPIGYRRELAGLRHAQLNLCRERAVLQDQEHAITHSLAEALVALKTAHESINLNQSRMQAAEDAVNSQLAVFEAGRLRINFLLDAQRRLTDARVNYYRSRVDHALALLSLHREKGTLLGYNGISLQEDNWCRLACLSHEQYQQRFRRKVHDYRCRIPGRVSLGPVPHQIDESCGLDECVDDCRHGLLDEDHFEGDPGTWSAPLPAPQEASEGSFELLPNEAGSEASEYQPATEPQFDVETDEALLPGLGLPGEESLPEGTLDDPFSTDEPFEGAVGPALTPATAEPIPSSNVQEAAGRQFDLSNWMEPLEDRSVKPASGCYQK